MFKFLKPSLRLAAVFGNVSVLGLMAGVGLHHADKEKQEPEPAPLTQDDPTRAVFRDSSAPGLPDYVIDARPVEPVEFEAEPAIMRDFSYEQGEVALNPYLVRALEKRPEVRGYLQDIKSACEENNLNWRICANQLFRESYHFKPEVIAGKELSGAGAVGIAQFMPETAKEWYGANISDLTNPKTAIPLYAKHMADLRDHYDGDIGLALIAYNGGQGAVDWIREELNDPDANGVEATMFLHNRYVELGNTSPSAWHVETRRYVLACLGVESPLPSDPQANPEFVIAQNKKFVDPEFVKMLNEPVVVTSPAAGKLATALETSARPVPRPENLAPPQSAQPEPRPFVIANAKP